MSKILSIFCAITFFINVTLHAFLFLGAPLGQFIWGGVYNIIPIHLRILNLFFVLFWSFCGFSYLAYGEVISLSCKKKGLNNKIIIFTFILFLASIFNLTISTSFFEKYYTGSLTVVTFSASFILLINKYPFHEQ